MLPTNENLNFCSGSPISNHHPSHFPFLKVGTSGSVPYSKLIWTQPELLLDENWAAKRKKGPSEWSLQFKLSESNLTFTVKYMMSELIGVTCITRNQAIWQFEKPNKFGGQNFAWQSLQKHVVFYFVYLTVFNAEICNAHAIFLFDCVYMNWIISHVNWL